MEGRIWVTSARDLRPEPTVSGVGRNNESPGSDSGVSGAVRENDVSGDEKMSESTCERTKNGVSQGLASRAASKSINGDLFGVFSGLAGWKFLLRCVAADLGVYGFEP